MIELVRADLLKLRRRRGLFWTVVALPWTLAVLAGVLEVSFADPGTEPRVYVEDVAFGLGIACGILCVVVAARLGAEEHAAGTIRYQVLTGTPRSRLYAAKALVVGLVALWLAAAVTLGAVAGSPFAGEGKGVTAGLVGETFWASLLPALVYSAISFGVGSLLRSTGPAIAVSLVLALGGTNIVLLLSLIDESLEAVSVDFSIDRLTRNEFEEDVPLLPALISVLAWTVVPLAAGLARLRRLEP